MPRSEDRLGPLHSLQPSTTVSLIPTNFRFPNTVKSTMTPEQSRKLKSGTRVSFNGDPADCGTVTATNANYVTIKWDDGHQSFTAHREMIRVELTAPLRLKSR
jgi:hypothetical protein